MKTSKKPYASRYSNMSVTEADEIASENLGTTKLFTVTARPNDPVMGSVSVQTIAIKVSTAAKQSSSSTAKGYTKGTVLRLTATAKDGYRFVGWADGGKTNPRTVDVEGNATYVANFEAVKNEGPEWTGTTSGTGGGSGSGSGNGSGAGADTATPSVATKGTVIDWIRKWWWAVAIVALMLYDLKGGAR